MGNPDMPTPKHIRDKLKEVSDKPGTGRYSMSRGIPGLRKAQAKYYEKRFGVKLNPENEVVVTLGSKEGLANLAQAISSAGDIIVSPNPSYPIHPYGFIIAGASLRHLQTMTDGKFDPESYLERLDRSDIDLVMNLQGDEPLIDIGDIINLRDQMIRNQSKLGTLASKINDHNLLDQQSIVKVVTDENLEISNFPKAKNFVRKLIDSGENIYKHLGIYCFERETLKNFTSLKQSVNEVKNNLEQLRALDNNININVALAKGSSVGVDTQEDFVAIKKIMEYKN